MLTERPRTTVLATALTAAALAVALFSLIGLTALAEQHPTPNTAAAPTQPPAALTAVPDPATPTTHPRLTQADLTQAA